MKRIERCEHKWWSNTSYFLGWCERRVKECPEEGSEETNFTKNEKKYTQLEPIYNQRGILTTNRLRHNLVSSCKHLNQTKANC
jgi:hypothetical protein